METERVDTGGKIAVVAVGGNSLLKSKELKSVEDQYRAICEIHGQRRRSGGPGLPADDHPRQRTAGGIHPAAVRNRPPGRRHAPSCRWPAVLPTARGHSVGRSSRRWATSWPSSESRETAGVDHRHPGAWSTPGRPGISNCPTSRSANSTTKTSCPELLDQHPEWRADGGFAGRGYRRVVAVAQAPFPFPETSRPSGHAAWTRASTWSRSAAAAMPVRRDRTDGLRSGVDAVIDKDARLGPAGQVAAGRAELLVISTAVREGQAELRHSPRPKRRSIRHHRRPRRKRYVEAGGNFAPGSMLPEDRGRARLFLRNGGEARRSSPIPCTCRLAPSSTAPEPTFIP